MAKLNEAELSKSGIDFIVILDEFQDSEGNVDKLVFVIRHSNGKEYYYRWEKHPKFIKRFKAILKKAYKEQDKDKRSNIYGALMGKVVKRYAKPIEGPERTRYEKKLRDMMRKKNECFDTRFYKVTESVIDYPQQDLDADVWDKRDSTYTVKPEIKKAITDMLSNYPEFNIMELAQRVHLTGSIGTNQYLEDTDVDVHVIVNPSDLPPYYTPEEWQEKVQAWSRENPANVAQHPTEVFLQFNPQLEMASDAVYDVTNDKWLKGPLIRNIEFDPYEAFEPILNDLKSEAGEVDLLTGELKRDAIDYQSILRVVKDQPGHIKQKLKARLEAKLKEIEDDIRQMIAHKQEWKNRRNAAYAGAAEGDDASSSPENVQFKFLHRYEYMKLISDLKKMLDDEQITSGEVETIQKMLSVMN